MKQIFTDIDLINVYLYKGYLENEGIETTVRNECCSALMGVLPMTQVYPELWIVRDEDYDRAIKIIEGLSMKTEENGSTQKMENHSSINAIQWILLILLIVIIAYGAILGIFLAV